MSRSLDINTPGLWQSCDLVDLAAIRRKYLCVKHQMTSLREVHQELEVQVCAA